MKKITLLIVFFFVAHSNAQESDKEVVKKTVEAFFEAFHKQDTTALNSFVSTEGTKLQSIWENTSGEHHIKTEEYGEFVVSIASIPDSIVFEEKLLNFKIQVDGLMANAWVSYEFWYNNEFSHCGVNNFQLFKDDKESWKIIYLVDTRRKAGCID